MREGVVRKGNEVARKGIISLASGLLRKKKIPEFLICFPNIDFLKRILKLENGQVT